MVEVDIIPSATFAPPVVARASQLQVQLGASLLVSNCMQGPGQTDPKGGQAWDFSESGSCCCLSQKLKFQIAEDRRLRIAVFPGDYFEGYCFGDMVGHLMKHHCIHQNWILRLEKTSVDCVSTYISTLQSSRADINATPLFSQRT